MQPFTVAIILPTTAMAEDDILK